MSYTAGEWIPCGGSGVHWIDGRRMDAHCANCPPWICDGCGLLDSMAAPCACWLPFEGVPMADIKAMFAGVGLGVGSDGTLAREIGTKEAG